MDSTAIYYSYPFFTTINGGNGKIYPYQKVIQVVHDINHSEMEAHRLKIKKHPVWDKVTNE